MVKTPKFREVEGKNTMFVADREGHSAKFMTFITF